MVIGHARHGKDSVCNLLRDIYNLSFVSSSQFVAEKAVRPWLLAKGIEYPDYDSMYADRVNHRADWFDAIADYIKDDPGKLGRELFAIHDIYCGIRNATEYKALKAEGAFDVCFWVDRGLIVDDEKESSNTMRPEHADFIINNNGSLEQLRGEVIHAMHLAKAKFMARLKVKK